MALGKKGKFEMDIITVPKYPLGIQNDTQTGIWPNQISSPKVQY